MCLCVCLCLCVFVWMCVFVFVCRVVPEIVLIFCKSPESWILSVYHSSSWNIYTRVLTRANMIFMRANKTYFPAPFFCRKWKKLKNLFMIRSFNNLPHISYYDYMNLRVCVHIHIYICYKNIISSFLYVYVYDVNLMFLCGHIKKDI